MTGKELGEEYTYGTTGGYGLTKRESFAMACLSGLLADPEMGGKHETIAGLAVSYADALLDELAKEAT